MNKSLTYFTIALILILISLFYWGLFRLSLGKELGKIEVYKHYETQTNQTLKQIRRLSAKLNNPERSEKEISVKDEILRQAREYGVDEETALKIAVCESNLDPLAVNCNTNGTNDLGVYQINDIHKISNECRLDYKCNIKWAMEEMSKNGFGAWYSSKNKWE